MKKLLLTVNAKQVTTVRAICRPYLHKLVMRRKNTRKVYIEIESGLLTRLAIRYELWKAGIKETK